MPLKSDIQIDFSKFDPGAYSEQNKKLNQFLTDTFGPIPKWWDVGAAEFRKMALDGRTPIPKPTFLPEALDIEIPSRQAGRTIPCRLIYPSSRNTAEERRGSNGVFLHIHGGGWVLGDHRNSDPHLLRDANAGDLVVISVGYRLAPEDPFPAGPEDCVDAAEYLAKNSEKDYGAPLRFLGGESAGAHLALVTSFHLLKSHAAFKVSGLLLHFGCYNFTFTPSALNYPKTLIISPFIMHKYREAFLPNRSDEEVKDPSISPYYENLEPFRGRLPPALFTCGTDDMLLDDSVSMGTRWLMAGGEAVIKIYPGASHGFMAFPPESCKESGMAADDTKTFIADCLEKS